MARPLPRAGFFSLSGSTLAATSRFKDSLTGRKRNRHLVPVRFDELPDFGVFNLGHRLFRGGLPPSLLAEAYDPGVYAEWLDSYYARDVQELFRAEKRGGFLKWVESVLRLSGSQLEATPSVCEHPREPRLAGAGKGSPRGRRGFFPEMAIRVHTHGSPFF